MALDRQSIEKKDFPVGQRGYDPAAVDAHLAAVAEQVDELKASSRRRTELVASSASEQVRAIVEAAENSASLITRAAEEEAREIREEATHEAHAAREHAAEQARDYVGRVTESTNSMMQRLDGMEQELSGLLESLRSGANRLNADLQLLEGDLARAAEDAVPRKPFVLDDELEAAAASDFIADPEPALTAEPLATEPPAAEAAQFNEAVSEEPPMYDPDAPSELAMAPAGDADDAEGARLIALNMALNGTPREETARYLSENFQLADAGGLLDEVYASVEG